MAADRLSRRELGLMGIGAAALTLPANARALTRPERPGVQLGVAAPLNPTDDDLKFLRQTGYDCAYVNANKLMSTDELKALKKRYDDSGVPLQHVRWFSGAPTGGSEHVAKILLNRPGRDESLEQCKQWLRNYGQAGFGYTIATLSITGVWSSRPLWNANAPPDRINGITRFSPTREFDANDPALKARMEKLSYDRIYEEDEILENYKFFLKHIVPVAEEHGVVINFHPDDPPTYKSLGGVARFNGTFAQIKRNIDLANSPNIGPVFCIGVWLEGGKAMGKDPVEALRYFLSTGKVREINFRNVSATVPKFAESFMDNGYADMYPFMKALVDGKFNGICHQDHVVGMVGAPNTYGAFSAGYMRALRQRALNEAKGRR